MWSLATKISLLAIVFTLVPVLLYWQFHAADEENQQLLLRSVRDQGRTIGRSLLPMLENADASSLPQLGSYLARFSGEATTIKLLFAPAGTANFYYVGSWPTVEASDLGAERQTLTEQGVLDRLAGHCQGEMPFSMIYSRPTGGAEIITAVTPMLTRAGCWAVVSSFSADAFPAAHLGEPYWATPTVRVAASIYLAMAVVTFSTLFGIRAGLQGFAERARQITEKGVEAGAFAGRHRMPELAVVAAEFDRMISVLHRSALSLRRAAEDNAHAFKVPIAVIRQSLAPLRRSVPADDQRSQRAIGMAEASLDRLDALVGSARQLDEASAELLAKPRNPVDLEQVIGRLMQTRSGLVADRDVGINSDLAKALFVFGNDEVIETVIENLLDNAISFSPAGGTVTVRLVRAGDLAHITVSDDGKGVPETDLERIFERYYTQRHISDAPGSSSAYFGIGLSIARRNVEAMNGTIRAENNVPHGLIVHVHLPLTPPLRLVGPRRSPKKRAS